MTDRLTPPMLIVAMALDECADIDHRYGDSGLARRYEERAAQIRRGEAARREAEAKPDGTCELCRNTGCDGACQVTARIASEREGPDSAAAHYAPPLLDNMPRADIPGDYQRILDDFRKGEKPTFPPEDKPAPADDLVARLRENADWHTRGVQPKQPFYAEAADRIEAQAREIAELKAQLDQAAGAIEDRANDREQALSDKEVAEARVRKLEAELASEKNTSRGSWSNQRDVIVLNAAEVRSRHDRVKWAEGLIRQLPETHDGRNSWLLNYSEGHDVAYVRERRGIAWDEETKSAALASEGGDRG